VICPNCNTDSVPSTVDSSETLLGYTPFVDELGRGHHHNDNCLKRYYACDNCDWSATFSIQRTCNVRGCGWRGKKECGRCGGLKLLEWPRSRFDRLIWAVV